MTIEKVKKENMSIYLIPLRCWGPQQKKKNIIMREIAMETKAERRNEKIVFVHAMKLFIRLHVLRLCKVHCSLGWMRKRKAEFHWNLLFWRIDFH